MFRELIKEPQIRRGTKPLSFLAGSWCLLVDDKLSVHSGTEMLQAVGVSEHKYQKRREARTPGYLLDKPWCPEPKDGKAGERASLDTEIIPP